MHTFITILAVIAILYFLGMLWAYHLLISMSMDRYKISAILLWPITLIIKLLGIGVQ